MGAVFNPILQTLSAENVAFFTSGVGSLHIICQQFQDLFATFGGCGSTLSLIIAMFMVCKSQRIKKLSKLALVPGIFGINEPIVFGLPLVLNPAMLIPFMRGAYLKYRDFIRLYGCRTCSGVLGYQHPMDDAGNYFWFFGNQLGWCAFAGTSLGYGCLYLYALY